MVAIAFGITDLDVGGAERTLVELVTRLDPARWSVEVVCLQPAGVLAEELRTRGIAVHSLNLRSPKDLPRALWQWRQRLRQQKPLVLQTFLYHANILGRLAGKAAGVSHIVSGIRVAERRSQARLWIDRWTQSAVCCHVCVSEGVRLFSIDAGLDPNKCIVIPNGVNVERIEQAEPVAEGRLENVLGQSRNGSVVLLFVGRLDPQKGLLDLLQAVHRLRDRPSVFEKLHLILIGDGPQKPAIEETITRMELHQHVHLAGWQPDVASWLHVADGLVLPSHWEGMPNAILEAMAAGLPVIGTNIEGSRELVSHGKTGWLVEPGRPDALADVIVQFVTQVEQRKQFGQTARQVAQSFSYENMVKRYEDLYLRVLEGKPCNATDG